MKTVLAIILSGALGFATVLAQEQKGAPMGGGMMGQMMQMHGGMGEMEKGMGGMMKGKGIMKGEEMKGMEQMMGCDKMTPEEMENMSGMMKQMSDCMKGGMEKTQ